MKLNFNEEMKASTINSHGKLEPDVPLPDYIKVTHAAKILQLPPEVIRKYCHEGILEAKRNNPGSGMWRIKTKQPTILNGESWGEFVDYCRREQEKFRGE
ncbi:hypothetical protein [Bacillus sp. Au-Bac7]|uniref:hypothetical protein n=2 Tax=Bacillaceae TaxID=186817 RepID=UPI001E530ABD|nr:hypothetical protein [Bacillus sp. Au-Bac7]MCE4049601.1 hypothetical protein [Bacillus sp. Au-Bac7]